MSEAQENIPESDHEPKFPIELGTAASIFAGVMIAGVAAATYASRKRPATKKPEIIETGETDETV